MPETAARTPLIRIAGLLYLVIILCGLTAELVLRGPLLGSAQPAAAILGALPRFRASLLADLTMLLADVALALLFFALLRGVDLALARAAMVFRLLQAALIGMALSALSVVPGLVETGETALALALVAVHGNGYDVGLVLFGVNSLLMAALLRRSGGVPAALWLGIAAAGLVYIAGGLLRLVAPELYTLFQPAYLVPIVAETAFCLWLILAARL